VSTIASVDKRFHGIPEGTQSTKSYGLPPSPAPPPQERAKGVCDHLFATIITAPSASFFADLPTFVQ
jgi:hypothetical protein